MNKSRYEIFSIGDKVISKSKIVEQIEKILSLRSQGYSQQEIAARVIVDKTFY